MPFWVSSTALTPNKQWRYASSGRRLRWVAGLSGPLTAGFLVLSVPCYSFLPLHFQGLGPGAAESGDSVMFEELSGAGDRASSSTMHVS